MDKYNHARYGTHYVSGTSAVNVNYAGFRVETDAVINTASFTAENSADGLFGVTLTAGTYYPISGSSITLTSGTVLLIKRMA